ncbi:hypothetical protein JZU54_03030, partial [bacterium]|nr:hypothetical protein [bacterium]
MPTPMRLLSPLFDLLLKLLPAPALARLRKGLLRYGKSQAPAALLARSQQGARAFAKQAAQHSEAYQTLLQEQGLNPNALNTGDWTSLPVLTKNNTFGRFTLAQLSRPHAPRDLADVLTSSGRGGHSFGFKLTTHAEQAWFDTDLGLQDSFKVDELDTLLINCLPMGVVFPSRAVTVANVSVRDDMACALVRDIGPQFQQILLCT